MIKIFEMFAGYGGASFALKKANIPFECVEYSEIKKIAIETYDINHPNIKNYGDCTKIVSEELPDFDVLFAGFPCQDVSTAGANNLKKGRTILINEVFRIAKVKQPKFIFLENVRGLIQKKHKEFFNHILTSLDELGYNVYWKVLKSCDYNTPQNRPRIYFVCIRKDLNLNFRFPEKEIYINNLHNYIDIPESFVKLNNKYLFRLRDITNKKWCYTILTNYHRNQSNEGLIKFEDGYRGFTKKEFFRLQGFFNDEIKIEHLNLKQSQNLAGDGWDINIISKIFKCIPFNGEYIKPLKTSLWED